MRFSDSTLFALNLPTREPVRRGRLFALAVVLTAAAVCAAMLLEAESLESLIGGVKVGIDRVSAAAARSTA